MLRKLLVLFITYDVVRCGNRFLLFLKLVVRRAKTVSIERGRLLEKVT